MRKPVVGAFSAHSSGQASLHVLTVFSVPSASRPWGLRAGNACRRAKAKALACLALRDVRLLGMALAVWRFRVVITRKERGQGKAREKKEKRKGKGKGGRLDSARACRFASFRAPVWGKV